VNLLLAEFEGAAGADQLLADLCAYGQGFVFLGAEGVEGGLDELNGLAAGGRVFFSSGEF
jgi:hypothetical protein